MIFGDWSAYWPLWIILPGILIMTIWFCYWKVIVFEDSHFEIKYPMLPFYNRNVGYDKIVKMILGNGHNGGLPALIMHTVVVDRKHRYELQLFADKEYYHTIRLFVSKGVKIQCNDVPTELTLKKVMRYDYSSFVKNQWRSRIKSGICLVVLVICLILFFTHLIDR